MSSFILQNKPWRESLKSEFYSQFQRLLMIWLNAKCCEIATLNVSKFGKPSSGHRTRKGQFTFQSPSKAMPKNAKTTAQLHSSHTLVK